MSDIQGAALDSHIDIAANRMDRTGQGDLLPSLRAGVTDGFLDARCAVLFDPPDVYEEASRYALSAGHRFRQGASPIAPIVWVLPSTRPGA